jgi:inorganic pyrophosphatase
MNIDLIPIGDDPPGNINVVIEVPVGGEPVKYEFDKKSGALFVDRILHTPMRYPANYGFVPHTLSPDGDPIDALVVARSPFIPGSVVRARPIAVLFLEDEHGGDEKLLTVPVDSTFPYYSQVASHADLPDIVSQQVEHFFTHYKDLEPDKWVRAGLIASSFAEEAEADLFNEQAVVWGGVPALLIAGFETLVAGGVAPEVAYLECVGELHLIAELIETRGIAGMKEVISNTAELGALLGGNRIVDSSVRERMADVLAEVRAGRFADERLERGRAEARSTRIEQTYRRLNEGENG